MATTSPSSPSPGLAGFWHDLPREGRLMLSIVVLEFLGTGLVLPFHVVYLHEVRDFSLSDVGLLLGLPPLMGLLVVGPGGSAIDRLGAAASSWACWSLLVVGNVLLGVRDHPAGRGGGALDQRHRLRHVLAGLAERRRVGDPQPAAAALLRGQLHPAQPRHRDRWRGRRLLRRRRPTPARSRRSTSPTPSPTSPRCCSSSARCATSPARSSSTATARHGTDGLPRRAAQPGDGHA